MPNSLQSLHDFSIGLLKIHRMSIYVYFLVTFHAVIQFCSENKIKDLFLYLLIYFIKERGNPGSLLAYMVYEHRLLD